MSRVLLVGLDGAGFPVLDPLMDAGVMPFLKSFADSGTRAVLQSVVPPLTPPAWASLMTGRSPGHHGIFDFLRRTAPGGHHAGFVTARDLGADTIWAIANRAGRRVTVLNFPLTFPPPRVDGYVVAGWMPWRLLASGCHPPHLYERLKALPGFDPRGIGVDLEMERRALEGCPREEHEDWVALHTRREGQWWRILRMLMRDDPCDLTAVLFDGMDKIQHLCWPLLDRPGTAGGPSDWAKRVGEAVLGYFRALDGILAELVDSAPPETTFIVASDHGFGAQTGTFFVNTWLEQHGYLGWAGEATTTADPSALGIGDTGHHVRRLDWARTSAYAPTATGYAIHIVRHGADTPAGVPEGDYARLRERLLGELREASDPGTGEAIVEQAWTREEVFAGPYMDWAPDLVLQLRDGGLPSVAAATQAYLPRRQPIGAHRREGLLIAHGPDVRRGEAVAPLSILDVAPLVLHVLGLPVPGDMEGRAPTEILDPACPPARVAPPATVPSPAAASDAELDPEAEGALVRHLRSLGYLE